MHYLKYFLDIVRFNIHIGCNCIDKHIAAYLLGPYYFIRCDKPVYQLDNYDHIIMIKEPHNCEMFIQKTIEGYYKYLTLLHLRT